MKSVQGKIVIITGASSGIGAATAKELSRRGATVVLAARRQSELDQLAREINSTGGIALAVQTDASKSEDLKHLVTTTIEHFGRIDVLYNNAGIGDEGPLAAMTDAGLERIVATNLLAPIRLSREVLPHMQRQRSGHIISTGSVASHIASPGLYSMTKFALRGFSDALRREVWRSGIHVSLVSPGFIRTAMTKGLKLPMPGPEAVALAVVGLIERPRREVVVPSFYRPLILLAKLWPWLADTITSRMRLFEPKD
ncbi:MAG: SDR family oxidoreductase [Herpetosiphonaceae bacterium]|nr:SDR family oxidoreductase [Herpetosiphonaceae bacterium]